MEQTENKNSAIHKIRKGSLVIAILCVLAAAFNALVAVSPQIGLANYGSDALSKFGMLKTVAGAWFNAAILLCASAVFFRISKSGMPFEGKNIFIVRVIGILCILNAFVPTVMAQGISGADLHLLLGVLWSSAAIEGILFLFIAQIMHYGALLQQESDETL